MSDLPDLSAGELVALVARGEASCVEVVGAHLDRIDALNPRVNAIVGLVSAAVLATPPFSLFIKSGSAPVNRSCQRTPSEVMRKTFSVFNSAPLAATQRQQIRK